MNNQSHSAGTYEEPFPTLQEALSLAHPGDVIYVYPGNGAPYEARFTLLDDERLLGSSVEHVLQTRQGPVVLPAQTERSPSLRSVQDGPMLTLGHRNQVSGFILDQLHSGPAVVGEESEGVVFANNTMTTPLSLSNCFGPIVIRDNVLGGGMTLTSARTAPSDLVIANNAFSAALQLDYSGEAAVQLEMRGNTSTEGRGVLDVCIRDSARVAGSITHNALSQICGQLYDHSSVSLAMERNVLQGIQWQGAGSSSMQFAISNNVVHSVVDQGIHLSALDQVSLNATVRYNTVIAPIGIKVESQALVALHVTHNALQGTKGIQCLHSKNSAPRLTFTHNTLISDSTASVGDVKGIDIELRERSHLSGLRIAENNWTSPQVFPLGSDPQGVYLALREDATATDVDISNNTLVLPIHAYHANSSPAGICIALQNQGSLSGMVLSDNHIDFPVAHYMSKTAPQGICIHPTGSAVITDASIVSNKVTFAPIREPLEQFRSNGIMLLPCDHASIGSV